MLCLSPNRSTLPALTALSAICLLVAPAVAQTGTKTAIVRWEGMAFHVPPGWKSVPAGDTIRRYDAPDSKPGREISLLLIHGPALSGDFREAFDGVISRAVGGGRVLRQSEVQATRSSEGCDVLVQAMVHETKEGQTVYGQYVAANVGGRMVLVIFVAPDAEQAQKYSPAQIEFVKGLDFPGAKASPAPPSGEDTPTRATSPILVRTPEQIRNDEDARRKPGIVSGDLFDSRGRRFHFEGVSAYVHIWGFSANGERVFFDAPVDGSGHYEMKVPHGLYVVNAYARFRVGEHTVRVALDPPDHRPTEVTRDSTPGIVTDFVLKLTGPVWGGKPDSFAGYHGGGIYVTDGANWKDSYFGAMARKYPAGSYVEVTLTPRSRLIDGTVGRPVVLKCDLKRMQTGHTHPNIPLAVYDATARLVQPDGTDKRLKVALLPDLNYGDTASIDFAPDPKSMEPTPGIPNLFVLD